MKDEAKRARGCVREHYEQERGPDGSFELFRWTDQDRKALGKKKLDEIINSWRESVKKGANGWQTNRTSSRKRTS